ncbi:MAG: phosphoglycerate dehydrogenase [Actinomycetota bacterium]|jgi:D-3-phosphoglycerate dehydrogenase|nr:phosphoglycerate dehydrogenase [Actinomycetota bacterium]MDA8294023.1 phosphoglycerate dehydrogenase [Actinomycetota bacterium]
MARVLVTEKLAQRGLDLLAEAGHDVDVRLGLSPDELLEAVVGAEALIIRSATTVTAEVLAAGNDLVVVGRAGIGLDNVDVTTATERGVMVVNAPQSNILSAAEQAMALMLAQARNVPQAHAALVAGKWERSKWEGVELYGKTLGIVGLGRVGALVAQRALAFGMHLVAYDPYVSADRARHMSVELMSLEDLVATADFVTIHLPKTPDTIGLFGADLLAKVKPGIRIVNTARGGIIDEDALAEAIRSGRVQGAGLDVFAKEPATESPLFELPSVVVAPHLGASTAEAQDKAGVTIAEQVILALNGDFVPFAVNVAATDVSETVRPFMGLAEQLGRILACLNDGLPSSLEIEYQGGLAGAGTGILTLSALKGVFAAGTEEPVSYVNAPQIAQERGLEVRETSTVTAHDYVNLITLSGGGHSVSGTLTGPRTEPRLVMVDDHTVEVPPAPHMVVVRNDDRAGMIGVVGTVIGQAGVSISSMAVGPSASGNTALMVLSTDRQVPADVLDQLRSQDGISDVHTIEV